MPSKAPRVTTPVPPTPVIRMLKGSLVSASVGSAKGARALVSAVMVWSRRRRPPSMLTKLGHKPLRQEIVGAVDDGTYEVRGAKFYNFYATDDELFETYIRVFPWSVDAPVLLLGIAFKTVDEPASVPRVLLDYKEEICHGVMGRMRMVPGTKWSDPNFSGFNESKYEKGIGKAKLRWFNNNSSSMVLGRRGFI